MNNKKTVLIVALVFVVLLGGAYVLYDKLGDQVVAPQLSVQAQQPAGNEEERSDPLQNEEDTGSAQENEGAGSTQAGEHTGSQEPQEDGAEKILAPDFTVYDLDGNAVKLSDFLGKPVVLNFWASWCGPCKSEMPDFDEAYGIYGEDIHFLIINMTDGSRETIDSASAFVEENGYSFPVYYDTDSSAAVAYGVYSLPTTYFIDSEGYAVAYGRGALDMQLLLSGIDMIYTPQ